MIDTAVIICGFDNTGKTTLIQQLMETFPQDLEMIKPPGPWPSKEVMMDWTEPSLQSIRDAKPEDKIFLFDRYPLISEPIYGPVIRDTCLFTPEELNEGFEVLMSAPQPIILVFCRPPVEHILKFGDREQMEGVIDRAHRLLDAYDASIKEICNRIYYRTLPKDSPNSSLVLFFYDWTEGNDWILSLIRNHIEQVRRNTE